MVIIGIYVVTAFLALMIIAKALRAELEARRLKARRHHYEQRALVAASLVGATQETLTHVWKHEPSSTGAEPVAGTNAPPGPPKPTLSEQAHNTAPTIIDELNAQARQDPVAVSRALRAIIHTT